MRLGSLLVSVTAVATILIATQGCSTFEGNDGMKEDKLCVPGAYVFCRCADRTPGTKLCKADAKSFEVCTTSDEGECVGGEIEDPQTNKPIPPGQDPDPNNNPPDKPNAIESCPGKSTAVLPDVDIELEGDTTTAAADRKGKQPGACAVGVGANDHVYRLIPSGSGSLGVKVQGSGGLDPVAYIRTTCAEEASQASCGPPTAKKLSQLKLNVSTGKEYFLIIDGASSTTGKYVATLKLTTGPFCGDGKVDKDEACDDGNHYDNDGCSPDCRAVNGNPTSGASCPGHSVDVWSGQTVNGTGSTSTSYGNAWTAPSPSSCSNFNTTGTNTGYDHVYGVTPHATGNLVVTLKAPPAPDKLADHMIAARRTCLDVSAAQTLCTNQKGTGSPDPTETLTIPVKNDEKVFVAIDGGASTNNQGGYSVSFELQ